METIIIALLLICVLYLMFVVVDLRSDIGDLEFRMDILKDVCSDYEKRIKSLESVSKRVIKRREGTNKYRKVFKGALSQCSVYCNNGWSVSKALLSEVESKAYRIFKGSIRPAYIRAKRKLQRIVYRA